MRILVLFAATLVTPLIASAQLWTMLPFGRTAEHVRNVLSRQPPVCTILSNGDNENCVGLSMDQLQTPGDFLVEPSLDLRIGALDDPLHFKMLLHFFNVDQELTRVDMMLDTDRHRVEGKNGSQLADLAGEAVLNELLARYGPPLEMSNACEAAETRSLLRTHGGIIDCSVLWKPQSSGQTINLIWKYDPPKGTYSLTVRYAAFRNSL